MGWFSDFIRDPIGTVVDTGRDIIDTAVDVVEDVVDFAVDVVGDVVSWIIDIPEVPDVGQQARDVLVNKNSNIDAVPVIYGARKVGGTRVFVETSGTDNKYLYMAIALCEGEVEEIGNIYINDEPLNGSKYEPYVTIDKKLGTDSQTVSSTLLDAPSWGSNDRLQGLAYLGVRLEFNQDVFSSIPTINAIVFGQKVYDPRTDTTGYSNNPALCLRDYLTNTRYGKGLDESLIDDTSFSSAANACDTIIAQTDVGLDEPIYDADYTTPDELANLVIDVLNDTFGTSFSSPSQISQNKYGQLQGQEGEVYYGATRRFSCNTVVSTDQTLFSNVKVLLSGMQGMMPFQNGQYRLIIEDDYDSSFDFDTDSIISGFKIAGVDKTKKYNRVTAKFVNPAANWQADTVIWPAPDSSDYTTFLSEDNNVPLEKEIDLNSCTSFYQARNIAKTLCLASRKAGLQVSFVATPDALNCAVGDIVTVTHPTPAWDGKEFRVLALSINYDATVNVTLAEHNATIYPWVSDEVEPESFESNLPDPLTVANPSLTITDQLRAFNQEAITFLVADVGTGDSFVERFEVQALKAGDTQYVNMGQAGGTRFELANVEDGATYTVRARAINSLGVRSAFTTESHQVVGKTDTPSDVTNLTGNLIGNQYLLTWDAVPDLDLSHYRIRFASEDGANTYQNSISLVPKVARPATSVLVPARNGTYFCKAVDKLGLASTNPATIVLSSNIDELDNFTGIQTVQEDPDFVGSFDDVVEIDEDDRLVLDTSLNFDDVTGNFDSAEGFFDGGAGNVDASGFYYFDNTVDLGAVFLVRATAKLKTTRVDYVNLFDSAAGLFDGRAGLFDGDVNAFDDVDVEVQARITEDDPNGTPTWSDWQRFDVSDFKARGLEFRAKLSTTDDQATPAVSELRVELFMGDRTEADDDVVSGAGSKTVTYAKPFKVAPALGIGAQDLQTGDYYELTSKSRTGFTITFYDSTDTIVSRTFDYVARGYGREVT